MFLMPQNTNNVASRDPQEEMNQRIDCFMKTIFMKTENEGNREMRKKVRSYIVSMRHSKN